MTQAGRHSELVHWNQFSAIKALYRPSDDGVDQSPIELTKDLCQTIGLGGGQ